MKLKTFILTFLMMMSSPFLFGEQTTGANYAWGDAPYLQNQAMMSAKLNLDGVTDYSIYEIGAFCGDVIRGKQRANSTGDFFLSIMLKESSEEISFRLYNHEADLEIFNVYETTTLSDGAHIGGPGNSVDVSATYVAKIGNAAYPTIEKAIAAAQEGETVTILEGNYTQNLDINKAITVQGERNDQDENLVNITGKLNITANNATAKNLNVDNGNGNGAYINAKNVTVDGCTVDGGNGFRRCYTTGLVTFKNSTITGDVYGIHFDGSAGGEIVIDNCDITGWTSFAKAITKVTMKNGTTFNKGNYNYIRFYQQNVDIDGCTFNEDMAIDIAIDGNTTTIDGCTFTNGNIEDLFYGEDIVNSTIIVNGTTLKREASIGNTYYETLAEAYTAATDGQTITLLADITLSEIFVIERSITLDGNGKTLTSTAGRAINVSGADGVTIKDLTINASGERAINVIQNATNVTIDGVTATAANYTVNLAGSAANAVVAVKNSNLTGLNVVNVAAAGAQVTVDKTVLNCADNSDDEKYAALALNKDAQGGSIIATEVTFNIAGDSRKATNQAENGTVTIDGSTEGVEVQVAYISYGDTWYGFATIEAAIAKANDGETIEIIRDITSADKITVTKSITINGNGKTLTYTGNGAAARAIDVPSTDGVGLDVTIKNLTVDCNASYCQRGINYNDDGKFTLDNVTVKGVNVTYAVNLPGSADNAEITIKNSDIAGNIALNVWGENSTINATNTTFTAVDNNTAEGYAAVKLNNDGETSAEGSVINITDGMIDVTGSAAEDTEAASNGTSTGEINISESTVVNGRIATLVAVIRYADGNSYSFETLPAAIEFAKAGETVALLRDITASDIITIDKAITLDGNGKKLTSTAGRAINVDCEGNVGIKNLTINASGERAINVIQKPANVTIDNVTATAANYTVNLASSAGAAKVAISNSTLNGLCTVNVAAAGSQVTVDYSTVNCNDNNTTAGESYAALCLNKEAVGGSIVATNTTVNVTDGSDSMKGRNGAENGTVTINGSTEGVAVMVAAITYEDSDYYYSFATLEAAVEFAKTGDVITLIRDITASNIITINKAITLDLNDKKVTSTAQKAFEVYAAATIKNGTIEAAQRCVDTRKAVELTLTGVTLIADEYTTHGNPQPLTIGGSENGTKVVMTNVNISAVDGYGIITFVKTELTATESAISGYSALYVKPGSDNSEFNFVNSDLSGGNIGNDVEGNSFSTIAVRANNVAVNVDAESTVTANGDHYYAISFIGTSENTTTGSSVTVAGEITGNILDAPNGNTVKVKAEYADELAAAGYATIEAENGLVAVIKAVAKIKETGAIYGTLQAAVNAAQSGNTIVLLADITEDVIVNNAVTINGKPEENATTNSTYTGMMTVKADLTIKNVNFDGKGYNGYAIETRGADYLTVEDCTAKNYGYGFIQLASGTALTTVKNVTVSNMNYGVKVDYSNAVVLENVDINCAVAAVLNSNYGEKTITIKNSNLSILGTWTRNNIIKTTYVFEGANTVNQFIIEEELDNFKLADVNSTLTAPNDITVTTDVEGYGVEYKDGKYIVVANKVELVRDGESQGKFATIQAAIDAAQANDVIVLLKDIEEDVTVNKSLTIDGKPEGADANRNYTGTMTGNSGLTVTVQNLNFVNAGFVKNTTSTIGEYTFTKCTFDGEGTYAYPLSFRGANILKVEDCSVQNYLYSFLYIRSGTNTVDVKNVTVENCPSYGVYFASGVNSANIENLTVKNSNNGFIINNTADRTFNLKGCKLENVTTAINHANGTNTVKCNLSGENDFGTSALSQYATIVLEEANATLKAPEGYTVNVTTKLHNQGYVVEYNEGVYSVVAGNVLNSTTGKKYATLQAAIDAAESGDVIEVIDDINVDKDDVVILEDANGSDKYNTFFKVEGKAITINLNGHNITGDVLDIEPLGGFGLIAIFSIQKGGNLTLNDNGNTSTVKIDNSTVNNVYSLISCYDEGTGSKLTINGGNYTLEKAGDNLVHSAGDDAVTINGGTFTLGNVGEDGPDYNYNPWIFNVNGQNQRNVIVKGGTFNADINHQFWANEVYVPETLALQYNGDEERTWTVVESVAYVEEIATSTNAYSREVGYATLAEAVNPLGNPVNNTVKVKVIRSHKLAETVIVNKDVEFIFENGVQVTAPEYSYENGVHTNPTAFRIVDATVTVNSFNITSGVNGLYNFILGAADGETTGNLVINDGTFVANTSVVSVTKGNLVIKGGDFSLVEGTTDYRYLINCIDANYNNETATVAISGGKFHKFNPENNAAEGAGTSFCAPGYGAIETAAGSNIWEVMPVHTHDFYTGWRWYSTYIDINGSEGLIRLEDALEDKGLSINHNVDGFVNYENGMWYNHLATLKETNVKNMYKIEVSGDLEMKLIGNVVDFNEAIEIKTGYNWIGYPFTKAVNLNEAFAETFEPAEGDYMISQFQFAFYYNGSWNGSLVSLNPGEGYIYERVDVDTELEYNVNNINRNVVKTNISTEDNKWTPNARMYPNNMTMIAVVDGAMGDNYEVAAFVNGEVRGSARPIYIEALDAYMMFLTIHGDEVEEMSFMYYDLTTGESYMLNDRFDYTNDAHLGSVKEPYVFSRGTTGIGDAAMSQVNIYPNPTTTGTEINLEAVCDTVEVFNALGVKVAEYQNVDSIDALETAGIYVIRITNDGNVQNCRLVVK